MKKGVLLLFFLVALSLDVYAIGISPSIELLDFKPDFTYERVLSISNPYEFSSDVYLSLSGDLANYSELKDEHLVLEPFSSKQFNVLIHLPSNMPKPGGYGLIVGAYEKPRIQRVGISGFARVNARIEVHVPYPGKYIETKIIAKDVSAGETAPIYLTVINKGKQELSNIKGRIEISYEESKKVMDIPLDSFGLQLNEQKEIRESFSTGKNPPGTYSAVAILDYDNIVSTASTNFGVGTLEAKLINHTDRLELNKINKFTLTVENKWNKPISGLYAEISLLKNGAKFKTPPVDLLPWEQKEISTYLDTNGYLAGDYDAQVDLYYEGKKTTSSITISIFKKIAVNITNIMVAVVALVVLIDFIVLVRRKRHAKPRPLCYPT
ncbi:MAG TPA: hypothetical protein VJC07_03755 [Candidatus Nanoarchaeia archaeon]|nr:hypothetical protein [Candidatus Nanoarchaeia archaeon]